jgi:hypothetical protein
LLDGAGAFADEPSTNAHEAVKSAGIKTDRVVDEIAAALRDLFGGKDARGTSQTAAPDEGIVS